MKERALELIEEIRSNINVCCAVTMDPDDVLELIEKLEEYLQEL